MIFFSDNPADQFAAAGLYVAERTLPASPQLADGGVAQIVGAFPWGPVDTVQRFSDTRAMVAALFGNAASPGDYGGARALLGKTFSRLEVVRVEADDAVKASRGIGANGYTVTAKYSGAVGNEITVLHTNNGDDTFDLLVEWNGESTLHEGLELADLSAFSDDWVEIAATGTGDTLEATDVAAVALTLGADGTLADADYTGTAGDTRGLNALLDAGSKRGVVCLAEYTSAAAITALREYAASMQAVAVAQAAADRSDLDAGATAAGAIADERLVLCLHGARQLVGGVDTPVDLAPFAVSLLSGQPAHFGLGDKDAARQRLAALLGPTSGAIADERAATVRAQTVGGVVLVALEGGGFAFSDDLTSDTSDPERALVSGRRVKDLVSATVARAMEPVQGKPDMDYYTRAALALGQSALDRLVGDQNADPRSAFIAAGQVRAVAGAPANSDLYQIVVSLHGIKRFVILTVQYGTGIIVDEVFAAAA